MIYLTGKLLQESSFSQKTKSETPIKSLAKESSQSSRKGALEGGESLPSGQSSGTVRPTESSLMWVDKYKPTQLKQIIGQTGDKSNAKKLLHWLTNWHKSRAVGVKPQGECSCMSGHEVKNILTVGSRSGVFISIVNDIGSTLPRLCVFRGEGGHFA